MTKRLMLHETLKGVLGSNYVYFQPPESTKMRYPAIVYGLQDINSRFANNHIYSNKRQYQVIIIDENPDSSFVDKMMLLPLCGYERQYQKENLNHNLFTLYY